MNFRHMPELEWEYGYFTIIGIILTACVALFLRFGAWDGCERVISNPPARSQSSAIISHKCPELL
jgi:hypothetical protein